VKVSVVIPCHNAEPYLAQTIGSVLTQTRPPAEIIVVNDASTDASLAVAERFGDAVRVVSKRCGSASASRNHGVGFASGETIMFLDADDVLGPTALEALSLALCRHPGAIALCPWYRLERRDGRWLQRPPSCEPRRGRDPLSAWLGGWYHPPCSVLWSRAAFQRVAPWDARGGPNDDGHMMLRAMALGVELVAADGGSAFYRRLPDSLSATRFSEAGLRARLWVVGEIQALLAARGGLHARRWALAGTLDRIARDAGPGFPALAEQCRSRAGVLGGPHWQRAGRRILRRLTDRVRRLGRRLHRRLGARTEEADHAPEIRHGLDLPDPAARPLAVPGETSPSVSVIIPTYNRARLLPRALASVLHQQAVLEVLVVDDGSSDDTEAVVRTHVDPRIRYLRQPRNRGAAAARNRGLDEARGEFIALLDSDDEWLPDKLALQLALFQRLPATVGMVYTGCETVDRRGVRQSLMLPTARGDIFHRLLERNLLHGAPSNALLRREAAARTGGFDEAMPAIEDYDYWLRLSCHYQVDFVAAPLSRYHDPEPDRAATDGPRLSRNLAANLAARAYLHRKHGESMRQAGVEHRFLLESARRHLRVPDSDGARRLVLQAMARAPWAWQGYCWLALLLLPGQTRDSLRRGYRNLAESLKRFSLGAD